MTPDFSPRMLRGFLHARMEIAGYRAAFPDERKSARRKVLTFDEARAAERALIIRRADVTEDQFELAITGHAIGRAARERLWKALGADPAGYGIRLLDGSKQERVP